MAHTKSHFISFTVTESANSTAQTSRSCSDNGAQIVALPAGRRAAQTRLTILDRDGVMSCLASMLSDKQRRRWTLNLPVWFPADDLHLGLNGESQVRLFSSRRPIKLLALRKTQRRMPAEENIISASSLCHPALRERTLRRLSESGGLQALIDQWDHSSLQELEAFIDSYFQMVWEQTMESFQSTEPDCPTTEQRAVVEEAGHEEVLSSIDRKLSKLELLDEIRRDLAGLRTNLEKSWKAIQELRGKMKQDDNNMC